MKKLLLCLSLYFIFAGLQTSCTFTKAVQDGESAFELKQYAKAIQMLQKEYDQISREDLMARKAYLLGKCYQKINNDRLALDWYKIAVDYNYGNDGTRDLAFAYKKLEMYDEAIATFRKLERDGGLLTVVRREITICQQAKEWKKDKNTELVSVELVALNSPAAEYAPAFYDNNYIVFTSDRNTSTGDGVYDWTGNDFSDLFIASKDGTEPILFDQNLNTENNEGAACFNKDFTEIFFTRCQSRKGDDFCKIMWSERIGTGWSVPVELFYMPQGINYGQPTLVENDSVLIFSANHPEGLGGYDLFYSVKDENGWSEPFGMPQTINTQGDEKFPVGDGDTLYFSSDYLPGLGGLDIFMTYLKAGGEWTNPQNLRAPINSGADDFSYIIDRTANRNPNITHTGFFSSSREGKGNDDIFKYTRFSVPVESKPDTPVVAEIPERVFKVYLAARIVEEVFEIENDPNSKVTGKKPIASAKVEVMKSAKDSELINTGGDGRIIVQLAEHQDYLFRASKQDYLNNSQSYSSKIIDFSSLNRDTTVNLEIVLDKIYLDKEIVLQNIYYDYEEWFIREDAKPSLDKLADIMKNNPGIKIQLSSHTDCRGEDDYNIDLSEKRARAAVNYIITTGINAVRLSPKGFGETRLEINCVCSECTEAEHQANRRTTFKIIN